MLGEKGGSWSESLKFIFFFKTKKKPNAKGKCNNNNNNKGLIDAFIDPFLDDIEIG